MAVPITEVTRVIRSKNAGPFELTFDIIFKDKVSYQRVQEKGIINKKLISQLYKINEEKIVSIIYFEPALAVKITIIRPIPAGSPGERDVYGAQQHAPLLSIEV